MDEDEPVSAKRGKPLDFQTLMEVQLRLNPHLDEEGKRKIASVIDERIKASEERRAAIAAKQKTKCAGSKSGEHCFCVMEGQSLTCCWCERGSIHDEEGEDA